MPTTVDEYIEKTRALIERGETDVRLEPTAALLHYRANSLIEGTGVVLMPDFGFLICWLRYYLTAYEFDPRALPLSERTEEELRQRRAAAEAGFDQLLADFMQRGYEPEMGDRLLEIADANFDEYTLNRVYVLPDDLDEALQWTGNPFKDRWGHEVDDDSITAAAIGFDLTNPEHREKLLERLSMVV